MRKSILVFAIIALGMAGGTVYFVQQWLKSERDALSAQASKQKKPEVVVKRDPKIYVLIAARPLPAGTFLKVGDARWQSWPDQQVPPQYIRRTGPPPVVEAPAKDDKDKGVTTGGMNDIPKALIGSVVRRGITAGQPVVREFLVRKGERGFLAAVLGPGMRAVSINVDDATGISGLVFPGDRVDVILTHETTTTAGDKPINNKVSETIIVNIRVLAIDQRTNDLGGKPTRARTVTLEVTPRHAEIIAVATRMGSLTLSLRSLRKRPDQEQTADVAKTTTAGERLRKGSIAANCVPGSEGCKDPVPTRGRTYTLDSEFSRFLSRTRKDPNINVIRGAESESVDPQTGTSSRNNNNPTKVPVTTSTTNTAGER